MDTLTLVKFVPGIIAGLSYVSYISGLLAGTTKTPPSTRFIMTVVYGITAWSMIKAGAWNWQFGAICAGSLCVTVVAACCGGMWKWSRYDTGCALASAAVMGVWLWSKSAEVALYACLAVQFIAWLATIDKLLQFPHTQDPVAFTLVVVSAIVQIGIQFPDWSMKSIAQPVVTMVIAAMIVHIIWQRAPQAFNAGFERCWNLILRR